MPELSAMEILLNAQFNFGNLEKFNPAVTQNPYYKMAKKQLDNAIKKLDN